MNGTWKISGSDVEFGAFAATMMACDGVDTWLSGASSATISGDEMTVMDSDGKKIGTLTKSRDALKTEGPHSKTSAGPQASYAAYSRLRRRRSGRRSGSVRGRSVRRRPPS